MKQKITATLSNIKVVGLARLLLWGDGEGFIDMKPYIFDHIPTIQEIKDKANDNGFGCQRILELKNVQILAKYWNVKGCGNISIPICEYDSIKM